MKSYFKFSNSLDSSLFEQWPNKHKISLFGLKTNEKEATFIFSVLKLVQKSTLHLLSCTATLPFSSYSFILMQMSKASICFYFSISHKTDYINFQLQPWQALQQQQKKWVCLPTTHDKEQMKYVSSSKAFFLMSFFFDHTPVSERGAPVPPVYNIPWCLLSDPQFMWAEQGTGNFCRLTTSLVVHSDKVPGLPKCEIPTVITRSELSKILRANIRLWSVKGRRDLKRSCGPFFH